MTGCSGGATTVCPLTVPHGRVSAAARSRLLLALVVALLGFSGAVTLAAPPAQADDGDLVVEIGSVSPAVLRTGDELTVTGRIRNHTEDELPAPAVRLLMQRHVPTSTDALSAWLDGTSDLNVTALAFTSDEDPIPAGGSVPFTITIPTDGTFDAFSAWGPRGVAIEATSAGLIAEDRTALLWYPSEEPLESAAELTLLVPLTPTAQEWADAVEQEVPVGETAAPRLLDVLDAVSARATLAIDPVLLETAPPGQEPSADPLQEATAEQATDPEATDEQPTDETTTGEAPPDPTDDETGDLEPPADPGHAELLEELSRADATHDLIALGYGDADVTGLTTAGGAQLWEDGVDHGRDLLEAAGLTIENVAWPPGAVTGSALTTLVRNDTDAVVLDAADITAVGTSGARASVTTALGSLDAVVTDADLGSVLMSTTSTGDVARQETLALSAVLVRSIAPSTGGLMAALPRDIGVTPMDGVTERIDALLAAPWLQGTDLRTLLGTTEAPGVSLEVPDDVDDPGTITRATVSRILDERDVVAAYTQAAGEVITETYVPQLLTPLATGIDPQLRDRLLEGVSTAVANLGASIRVEAGSNVLLITDAGNVPVTVTNNLPVEARVLVQLVPVGTRLQVREIPEVVLPPEESTTVRIPVTAVANGNVTVDVSVLPAGGDVDLAPPASFSIRVRAEWENIGTGVVAGLLVVAFVIGLIRTIRRGGRRAAAE